MGNLYYEQLERECDPELLHLHISRNQAVVLQKALYEYVDNHDKFPVDEGIDIDILYRKIVEFLRGD